MKSTRYAFLSLLTTVFLCSNIFAQSIVPTFKTFEQEGLKFNYPPDWTITNKSSKETQYILLSKAKTNVLISIVSPRALIESQRQFRDLQESAFNGYVKALSKTLSAPNKPSEQEYLCLDFNGKKVSGTKFVGIYNNEPSRGEIYPFILGRRFLSLAYIRTDKDGEKADAVWQEIIRSINLSGSNQQGDNFAFESEPVTSGSVLNSKALKLVRPPFTKAFAMSGAGGEVRVKVTIDETGKVVSAKAISGHSMLYKDSENAALKSKFTPTMQCDTPVKVTGIIVYNFARNWN